MQFDFSLLVIVVAVFAVGGVVKGVVGFGLPTIAMGLLGALIGPDQAAAIIVVPTLLTNVWQAWRGTDLAPLLRRLWPMMAAIFVGTIVSAKIIVSADPRITTSLVGFVLAAYAVLGLSGWRFKVPRRTEPWSSPLAGLATGMVNGSTAIFVLPTIPYMQAIEFDRDEMVRGFAFAALAAALGLGIGLGINRPIEVDIAAPVAVALVAAFAGMAVGQVVRAGLPIDVFQRWVYIGLLALGASMFARAIWASL